MLFTEQDVQDLSRVQFFFQTCADGIRAYGTEGLDEKFANVVDDKYRFIVESHAHALSDFHARMQEALTSKREASFTGADVTLMISTRYWVSEIFDLCCQCPVSMIAEHMSANGCMNLQDTKSEWERFTGILRAWLRILYQAEMHETSNASSTN